MVSSDLQYTLPSSDELIDSDDFPVDNEDQNFIPNVLLFLLEYIWKQRQDWYFAVDMGGCNCLQKFTQTSLYLLISCAKITA